MRSTYVSNVDSVRGFVVGRLSSNVVALTDKHSHSCLDKQHRARLQDMHAIISRARTDVAATFRHFRRSSHGMLTSSAPERKHLIWMSCAHASLRTKCCNQLLIAMHRCPLWLGRCNQSLASGICLACQAQRGSSKPNPLLPCQITSQNNFNLRIFSRVLDAMSSPALFLCQALPAHRHLLGHVELASS